jgi:carboxyl-terminal processing protease
MTRPTFKSDAGRVVYGGGGIRPDVLVADDTLTTAERDFARALSTQVQVINTTLQDYALELKGTVKPGFTPPAEWTTELMRRLDAANVKVDPKFAEGERVFLIRDLAHRVARMSFGDAGAKAQFVAEDHQLVKAVELLEKSGTQAQLLAAAAPSER